MIHTYDMLYCIKLGGGGGGGGGGGQLSFEHNDGHSRCYNSTEIKLLYFVSFWGILFDANGKFIIAKNGHILL